MQCPICKSNDCETVLYYSEYPLYIKPVAAEDGNEVPLKPLEICICNKCGFIFQNMNYDLSELSKIYEVNYSSYHSPNIGGIGKSLAEHFMEFLCGATDISKRNVLEIGCYDGYFLMLLRDGYGCEVIGCDPSPGSDIAKSFDIPVIKDYFSPNLFKEKYDLVILRCVLEHINEPIEFLEQVTGVLKPGGYIAVEVPNVQKTLENGVIGDFFHEHINYFSKNTLVQSFGDAGFKLDKISGDDNYIWGLFVRTNDDLILPSPEDIREEVSSNKQLFDDYAAIIDSMTASLRELTREISDMDVYIYGGGGHTISLLSKTNEFLNPSGIIDGDPAKEGKVIPSFSIPIYSKELLNQIDLKKSAVIISSKVFQKEILNELKPLIEKGLTVITIYPEITINKKEKN